MTPDQAEGFVTDRKKAAGYRAHKPRERENLMNSNTPEERVELIAFTELLAAWTPEDYPGDYPPYFNLAVATPHKGSDHKTLIKLTTRLPSSKGMMGEANTTLFTPEMWAEFIKCIPAARVKYDMMWQTPDE